MIYKPGTKLIDMETGEIFEVLWSNKRFTTYQGASGRGKAQTSEVANIFEVDRTEGK